MTIPETTLESWSHLGSVQQSAATYQTIKRALEDSAAPYAHRSFDVYLQGSYGNDTNIRIDSDVDIVISTSEVFYFDVEGLPEIEKENFERAHPGTGKYSFFEFKNEVTAWIVKKFGAAVDPGSKAVRIKADGTRRNADVLIAADFRHYWNHRSLTDASYARGIVFWKSSGVKIINYPRQHSDNCTIKHQNTLMWFKPTVRIVKNMRNRMIDGGLLEVGEAPSYYIEGLLSNVPNGLFGGSYGHTLAQAISYLKIADRTQMTCANGIHWLVRTGHEVCWSDKDFTKFVTSAEYYWSIHGKL